MKLIINHSSMQPIYEQIVEQIKNKVMHGELKEDTMLPSVRTLAKELKVSALTVKKSYDVLEEEGFVNTVHGKGSRSGEGHPEGQKLRIDGFGDPDIIRDHSGGLMFRQNGRRVILEDE